MSKRREGQRSTCNALLVLALLLSVWSTQSSARDSSSPDHGLAKENTAGAASPAMTSFFMGTALPEAAGKNSTADPIWDLTGKAVPALDAGAGGGRADGRDRARTVFLTVGIVCGAVGVGLVAAAAFVYMAHARMSRRGKAGEEDMGRLRHDLEPV